MIKVVTKSLNPKTLGEYSELVFMNLEEKAKFFSCDPLVEEIATKKLNEKNEWEVL